MVVHALQMVAHAEWGTPNKHDGTVFDYLKGVREQVYDSQPRASTVTDSKVEVLGNDPPYCYVEVRVDIDEDEQEIADYVKRNADKDLRWWAVYHHYCTHDEEADGRVNGGGCEIYTLLSSEGDVTPPAFGW